MTGLEANFSKTCLYSVKMGELPNLVVAAATLNCFAGLLPVTYLGLPISGRRPRRQEWEGLILKVCRRLSLWKVRHLSLGGRLTMVNSVLMTLPTYWMAMFKLSKWVTRDIDRIMRDFLWSGPDLEHPGCRLVKWQSLFRAHDQGGWGILDLTNFNRVLLGKWRWKFATNLNWSGVDIILFNYGGMHWNLFPRETRRISYFWKGVIGYLPPFRCCTFHVTSSGAETFFWKDR
ncbi:hypothetical protein IHE45_04G050900 [Dioscorea alata]|uniref:Uncharacterized protein n=1 Tax=Dioscorea alata TaxID=55571 RepID=A0ACB7WCU9_DIOAL|nr:hypothetical protein IHE45_04G050900 [Dioscorea alata]